MRIHTLIAVLVAVCAAPSARAAQPFPFVIPWDDSSPSLTDVSGLNDGPAGSHGNIIVKDGHFVEQQTGRRVRFLAVNFAAAAAFPSHEDAEKVAARLAKYGVNLVRLHHMDNNWNQRSSLIDFSFPDHQHLNPGQIDRLDYLIYELRQHGIYVNINLHVSRTFTEADGFPASVSQIPFDYDKRVDYFDRRMIALQKKYAHDLLTHVNPYTHRAYTDEPAVLNVELTNEDSLVGDAWTPAGSGLSELPAPFSSELQGQWNDWLAARYPSTAALEKAWAGPLTIGGPELLKPTTDPASWTLEHQDGTAAALETSSTAAAGSPPILEQPDAAKSETLQQAGGGAGTVTAADGALKVDVTAVDGTDWHVQLHQTGLDLKNGQTYTLRFRARSDAPRAMSVYTGMDEADWHHVGLEQIARVGRDWKTYEYFFTVHDAVPGHSRLSFVLGSLPGTVWLADVVLKPGLLDPIVKPGESMAAHTIPLPSSSLGQQQQDWIGFLADTERNYVNEMRRYLKSDLHLHALIIGSQISYGGLAGVYREASSDFTDNHAYWQHPSFPGKPWDPVDWRIPDTSMVPTLGSGDELSRLAEERILGKPYTVSEYNHPAPNDFQAETVPLLSSFAAFQDWDAIYLFDYGDYGQGAPNNRIDGYFGVGSNPAKWAFMPAAAMIFRAGEGPVAAEAQPVRLPASVDYRRVNQAAALFQSAGLSRMRAFQERVGLAVERGESTPRKNPAVGGITTRTTDPEQAVYLAQAPDCEVVVGFVGGQTIQTARSRLVFGDLPNRFAAVTITSQDEKSIETSNRLLLTAVDRVENTGMQWNAAHNSVGNHWGTAPSIADGVPVAVTLKTDGPRRVFALDSTGKPAQEVPATYDGGHLQFKIGPESRTLWYAIVKR